MGTFESLEDNFSEKASQSINTDFEEMQKRKLAMSEDQAASKETYEDKLRKKTLVSGLAAMFEARIKNVSQSPQDSDEDNDDTITFASNTVRYEDQITIPQNEVSEEDIQRFFPHEKYNDVHVEPTNIIKEEVRHDTENKYGDMLNQFEPRTASEDDITEGNSISSLTAPGEPSMNPSNDEVLKHIESHRQKKSEEVLTKSDAQETILEEDTYLTLPAEETTPTDLTRPPFKGFEKLDKIDSLQEEVQETVEETTDSETE